MFSTLTLAEGPLTVYDLERVDELPEIMVLSTCSVASSASINGGTLFGPVEGARCVRSLECRGAADTGE